jgi:hypothetical protein
MLQPLAGDVADLQRRQKPGRSWTGSRGPATSRRWRWPRACGDGRRWTLASRSRSRTTPGTDVAIFAGDARRKLGGGGELLRHGRKLVAEAIDFLRAGLNAFADLVGKAGEFCDAGAGDLDRNGEGAEIAHRFAHIVHIRLHLLAGCLQLFKSASRACSNFGSSASSLAVERMRCMVAFEAIRVKYAGQRVERGDEPLENIGDRDQYRAALKKLIL